MKILVTRPANQSDQLCTEIRKTGAAVLNLPLLEIAPPDISPCTEQIDNLVNEDIIIFISRNAVEYLLDYYNIPVDVLKRPEILAIGFSTAQTLNQKGVSNVVYPEGKADSETLLSIDNLKAIYVKGKKISIIRGQGGRNYLADNLESRGAKVSCIEVYKRKKPEIPTHTINSTFNDFNPDLIIVLSADVLQNLFDILDSKQMKKITEKKFMVFGNRIADKAKQFGVKNIVLAEEFSNQGILNTLQHLNQAKL